MPILSRWFMRAALIYFLTGFTIGALLLAHKGIGLHAGLWAWLPIHIEMLLIGWIVQLTMGVGYWILPRYWQPPRRPRPGLAAAAFGLLNAGILVIVFGTLWRLRDFTLALGRAAEVLAVITFAAHAWGRIVGREGR